jgi:hypothetical protein
MSDVIINKKNEVFIKLQCEPHILYELSEYFTFEVENAKFMPRFRNTGWDGKIHLLNVHTGEIYAGLLDKVISKLKSHNYTYQFEKNKYYGYPFETNDLEREGLFSYVNDICNEIKPRDYQINAIYEALKYNRKLLISPTSSGKSANVF